MYVSLYDPESSLEQGLYLVIFSFTALLQAWSNRNTIGSRIRQFGEISALPLSCHTIVKPLFCPLCVKWGQNYLCCYTYNHVCITALSDLIHFGKCFSFSLQKNSNINKSEDNNKLPYIHHTNLTIIKANLVNL